MKLQRLIPLTCSVALAAALTACGGGGEVGPKWAQTVKAELKAITISDVKSYALPCSDDLTSSYSEAVLLVSFKTSDGGAYEQIQRNWFIGTGCQSSKFALVIKVPADKVSNDSTFTDPDLGLLTTRQTKTNPGGSLAVTIVDPTVTAEFLPDANTGSPILRVTLPPSNGATAPFLIDQDGTISASKLSDLAAFKGDLLYWGDGSDVDSKGYPTHLLFQDLTQVFTLTPNTKINAPVLAGATLN